MEQEKHLQELSTTETEFNRELGVFGGVSIIGGIMIGSGIFYLGSYVLERTGMSLGLALLAWIVGGVVTLLAGLCYAELGVSMPRAGGSTVYLTEAFHPAVGFLRGFTDWLIGGPGSIAAMAIALPTAMRSFWTISDMEVKIIATFLIILLTVYNLFGIKQGAFLQNVSMVAKLIPILIILFAALFLGTEQPDLSLIPKTNPDASFFDIIPMIAFATVASLWAYEGWTNLNSMTEEMKNPKKNLPKALIVGIGGITILYTLFNFAIYKVLPYDAITTNIENGNLYLGTEAARSVLGNWGGIIVSLGMILAMFGGINGLIIAQPRMYYAMAVEGHFFKSFAKLHPKYKVPTASILVQMFLSIALVFSRNLDQLTSLVVFTAMLYNLLTIIAVWVMRRRYPELHRPYRVAGYPWTVLITAVLFIGLLINTFTEDSQNAILGMGVQVLGILVYWYFDRQLKRKKA
ncbi:amino acid permease [Enterococcus hulanensis]|uniref:Amino acid permease n=1 Tax=Enterococcus hulanensis TaxID=2559929 RepID=A0ABU3EZE0_9ENTE|nr:amino acid permease [Enterococcus hulanensis]MDT2600248.1 amino acid permease [Enterococcus hulanensis]MDT2609061.1 amino acid permease [Enterococcus hulanensis]MDT2616897.1 amino acid permease [Enterococcus hulanensis]MDT2628583.1 amino acid permease [Enterococcus hulanensis]MDT2655923.1 amino acid permease [Enterococcus hulanensis]